MTPDDAAHQARFLARAAREHGASWPRLSSHRYAGEQLVQTAYSTYRVVDGRCIVVQRALLARNAAVTLCDDDQHECLGLHLVGYLIRHDDTDGLRWTLHGSPRVDSKAVFWRASRSGEGQFVVTSRVAPPTTLAKKGPPPLPVRSAGTPTGGVSLPVAARALPPLRQAPPRAVKRAERMGHAPPPPPPRCMKRDSR